ncbi:MAG: hypothetical protein Q8O00_05470 [Holophaga sp.]|nr:hypothetical protein [Holophaga sp.]
MLNNRTLEEQRHEFSSRRFLAMPIAGTIAWSVVGIASFFLPPRQLCLLLFSATGSIVYLGMFISRFTGENFLDKSKPKNVFDSLFMHSVAMSLVVYGIAIPFFLKDYSSLPLSIGVLTGLMWIPFSWIIQHWIGLFHTIARTVLILIAYYLFPSHRFLTIPAIIVVIYLITISVFEKRFRSAAQRS